jgi:CRISPR-associated protein Csm5
MKYKLTALTPLLVGDGRELSPVDYMVWKDQVNVLDQTRIFKLLARGPRLEGYLSQLRKATRLDFASWGGFAQSFSQRRIAFDNSDSTSIWNAAPTEALFIPTFAATYRGAYVPASAIKGALRTGLVHSRWSTATMEKIAASLEGDRIPRRIADAAESQAGASQVRILGIADSDAISENSFKIYLTRTASLDTRQPEKPQLVWKISGRGSVPNQRIGESSAFFAEMAVPGTSFEGDWAERTFLKSDEFARPLGWRSVPSIDLIVNAANQYAAAQLEIHANYARVTGLVSLQQNIQKLREQLAAVQNTPSTCLVCLGWGNGFLAKAAYLGTDQAAYRKLLRSVPALNRAIRDDVVFPKTRRIVFGNGNNLSLPGWVSLQLQR